MKDYHTIIIWFSRLSYFAAQSIIVIHSLVKNTKMFLKYIYLILSILQINVHIYLQYLIKNTLNLYFSYNKLLYVESDKL